MNRAMKNQGSPSDDTTGMTDEEKQLQKDLGDTSQEEDMTDESY